MSGNKLGNEAKLRLKTMEESNDGFYISEVDLKLRGPGDLEGTQQSGLLDLHLADLRNDDEILAKARNCAEMVLTLDPDLLAPEHAGTRSWIARDKQKNAWSLIS
jgi:ATP-dependent DNA helicase RecG